VAHNGKCITVFSALNYWWAHTHTEEWWRNVPSHPQDIYVHRSLVCRSHFQTVIWSGNEMPNNLHSDIHATSGEQWCSVCTAASLCPTIPILSHMWGKYILGWSLQPPRLEPFNLTCWICKDKNLQRFPLLKP